MKQRQREWQLFGHVFTGLEVGIVILLFVVFLSGVAGIWIGLIANVPLILALVGIGILIGRTATRHKVVRMVLLILETFVWTSAVAGGIAVVRGIVFGQVLPMAWLAGTPFSDYTIPGLSLMIVVGGSALLAAMTVFIDREWALLVAMLAGLLMAGYEVVEVISIDSKIGNGLPIAVGAQLIYFMSGLAVLGLAGLLWMRDYRRQHSHSGPVAHA